MALLDQHLESQIKEAKKIIEELPSHEKECVKAYINSIQECLDAERKKVSEFRTFFEKLKNFIR